MKFSRIMLGTVQFGLEYGIANVSGKPSFERVCEILQAAYDGGVTALDTAAAYGTSEEVVGRALERLSLREAMTVVSKIPPIEVQTEAEVEKFIEQTVLRSLERLRLKRLPVCLLHREEDVKFMPVLEKMIGKGLIEGAGISLDSDRFLNKVASVRFIQLPYNILDRRFDAFWPVAVKNKNQLFSRSVYLQGLLLMPEERIKPGLSEVIPVRHRLEGVAKEAGCTMAELCMRYVLSNTAIASVLTGVDTTEQVRENLRLAAQGPLSADLLARVRACVPDLPESLIRPALWKTRN
jgi:aryl-alcohol dehydrogenase-like predicted oxidoreductase